LWVASEDRSHNGGLQTDNNVLSCESGTIMYHRDLSKLSNMAPAIMGTRGGGLQTARLINAVWDALDEH